MATLVRSAEQPQRKVWTREEVARLGEMFAGQRYELIEGDLINKMGPKAAPRLSDLAAQYNFVRSVSRQHSDTVAD